MPPPTTWSTTSSSRPASASIRRGIRTPRAIPIFTSLVFMSCPWRNRALGRLTPLRGDFEVMVDSPLHRLYQFLDRLSFEVDLVAEVDHVTGKESQVGVELDDPSVSLVVDHRLPSTWFDPLVLSSPGA